MRPTTRVVRVLDGSLDLLVSEVSSQNLEPARCEIGHDASHAVQGDYFNLDRGATMVAGHSVDSLELVRAP